MLTVFDDRILLGEAAALAVGQTIRDLLAGQPEVNIIFAAAPSQNEFLQALCNQPLDWKRVNAFHMDEYVGLRSFSGYLRDRLVSKVSFGSVHFLDGHAPDPVAECRRYAALLQQSPPDIVCMGIGENSHLAFNDPGVADFNDPVRVKVVTLDGDCRRQQVNDGCFPFLEDVPQEAMTLTIPALMRGRYLFVVVPGERKATAVYHTLNSPVTEHYPSTVLRRHEAVRIFLDRDSSRLL